MTSQKKVHDEVIPFSQTQPGSSFVLDSPGGPIGPWKTNLLYRDISGIRRFREGCRVTASSADPTTFGHSERVATDGVGRGVIARASGPFKNIRILAAGNPGASIRLSPARFRQGRSPRRLCLVKANKLILRN